MSGCLHQFSGDCGRLARVSQDGRLVIWNTSTSDIMQQYSPSSHLSAQITCLAWSPAGGTTKTKKRKSKGGGGEGGGGGDLIALGTSSGTVLLYSVTQGDIVTTFEVSNYKVLSLQWSHSGNSLLCGAEDGEIAICSIVNLEIVSKIKSGKSAVQAVGATTDDKRIVSAGLKLQVWDVKTKNLVQTFVGHANKVVALQCVQSGDEAFILSAAAEDRNLSVWRVDSETEKPKKCDPVYCTLSANESIREISCLNVDKEEILTCATTDNGSVLLFRYSLEKPRKKPIKPYSKLQIMHEKQDKVSDIPIHSAQLINRDTTYLSFSYGSDTMLKFEEMKVSELRDNHILAREMPVIKMNGEQHKDFTKVVSTKNADDVKFLMSGGNAAATKQPSSRGEKRRGEAKQSTEQSLEERLALLKPSTGSRSEKTDSYAKLLVQGLHSKNQSILMSVLDREDSNLVESSVRSLPVEYVVPLLEVLHSNIQSKSFSVSHVVWAQSLVRNHVGFLVSSPHVQQDILLPLSDLISARTANFLSVVKLKGKIEMIRGQMEHNRSQGVEPDQPPKIVFDDESSADESDNEDNNDGLLPARADYDSDFLDEYLSGEGSSSDDDNEEDENGDGGGSSSDEAEIMETENGTVMVNGHDSDDMDED